jgi:hypothetical protein
MRKQLYYFAVLQFHNFTKVENLDQKDVREKSRNWKSSFAFNQVKAISYQTWHPRSCRYQQVFW